MNAARRFSDGDRVQMTSRAGDTFAGRRGVVVDASPEERSVRVAIHYPSSTSEASIYTFDATELRHDT